MSELNFVRNLENNAEEQAVLLELLRAYAVSKQSNIQLPSVTVLDEIAGLLDISRSRAKEVATRFAKKFTKEPAFELQISTPAHLGMFNATCDTGSVVDLSEILRRIEDVGFDSENVQGGYEIIATKVKTYYGKFNSPYEYTKEYGPKKFSNKEPNTIQILMKVKKGDTVQGATVNIWDTGRIRFSGGYFNGSENDVRAPLRYVSSRFFQIRDNIALKINNNTATLKMNARVKLISTYALFESAAGLAKYQDYTLTQTFEPKKFEIIKKKSKKKTSPFLYIHFKGPQKFTINLATPGSIKIEGATDMQSAIRTVKGFMESLRKSNLLTEARGVSLNTSPKTITKAAKRVNMKPSPEVTRRGTSCPMDRRPNPYSFEGSCPRRSNRKPTYIRPNPQGQPCCYKIPKSTLYSQNKVERRFNKANVKVPNKVRRTFGFGNNTNAKQTNVGRSNMNLNIYFNKTIGRNGVNPVGIKIGSRQCLRFSKVALVDIIRRKSIQIPKGMKVTKPNLCQLLADSVNKRANSADPLPRYRNGVLYLGKRKCESYDKNTLRQYARVLGINVNENMSKKELCLRLGGKKTPKKLPANLQRNIKAGKVVLKKRKRTPTPSPPKNKGGPSKPVKRWGNTPSPSPNNENFANILEFARKLNKAR